MAAGEDNKTFDLGVDLGGTKVAVCSSDFEEIDDVSERVMRFPSHITGSQEELVDTLFSSIDTYIENKCAGKLPRAIGFGLKDAVDNRKGIWLKCPSSEGFSPLPLAELVYERYGVPAFLDNDVHAATLAELQYGAGQRYKDFLYLNVGTGIAVGAVIEGKLMRGASNYAGEIGHISVETEGETCTFCGLPGCLENIASGQGINEITQKALSNNQDSLLQQTLKAHGFIRSTDVFSAADMGDELAQSIADRVTKALVIACVDAVNIFNPEAIIFGGGVMSDGWLLTRLQDLVPRRAIATSVAALQELSLSELGSDYVGVLGALSIAQMG